eukprot:scaffold42846_cov50-Cyclotella_meneghiniana.AAC.1
MEACLQEDVIVDCSCVQSGSFVHSLTRHLKPKAKDSQQPCTKGPIPNIDSPPSSGTSDLCMKQTCNPPTLNATLSYSLRHANTMLGEDTAVQTTLNCSLS